MYLIQGRKKFNSLDEAKVKLDPEGGRVAIIGEERVATIRPQIVHNFPGTLQQLFDLGLKLGGYPVDAYLKSKNQFNEQDAMKEMFFARTFAFLEWVWEQKHGSITSDLISYLTQIIRQSNLLEDLHHYETVEQLLQVFKTNTLRNGNFTAVPATEAMNDRIEQEIVSHIGVGLSKHLLNVMPKELDAWINDPYSPYCKESLDFDEASYAECYLALRKHPDIQKVHDDFMMRVERDLLQAKPSLLLMKPNKESIFNRRESAVDNLIGDSSEGGPKNIFGHLTEQQKQTMLQLYFAKYNPIKLIHEAMVSASFSEHLLAEHKGEIGDELKEHLDIFLNELGDLQKLENIFMSHPLFAADIIHDMLAGHFENVEDDEHDHDPLFIDEEDEDGREGYLISEQKDYFNKNILQNTAFSWREKGLLAYAFFVNNGVIDLDDIEEVSLQSKQTVRKSLKRLLEIGAVTHDFSFDLYTIELGEFEDDYYFGDEPYTPFIEFFEDYDLSWEAKAINVWFEINGSGNPEELMKWSTDNLAAIKKAFKELEEAELIMSNETVMEMKGIIDHTLSEIKETAKERVTAWYNENLKDTLHQMLRANKPSADMLNAKYPAQSGMTALQIVTIANDIEALRAILKIEGIDITDGLLVLDLENAHPLMLAFDMKNLEVLPILLDSSAIIENQELVGKAFKHLLDEENSGEVLKEALQHLGAAEYRQDMINWLLVACVMEMEPEYAQILLQAGASPNALIINGDESVKSFVNEHDLKVFIDLFNSDMK